MSAKRQADRLSRALASGWPGKPRSGLMVCRVRPPPGKDGMQECGAADRQAGRQGRKRTTATRSQGFKTTSSWSSLSSGRAKKKQGRARTAFCHAIKAEKQWFGRTDRQTDSLVSWLSDCGIAAVKFCFSSPFFPQVCLCGKGEGASSAHGVVRRRRRRRRGETSDSGSAALAQQISMSKVCRDAKHGI
ncbi:hypothetical protein BS50DRAFT_102018 [Corynespora cassiicola Philippines]|uniref:Uncharacterized protein n=1 Tax=Corynespora cassiicola Philippines TaxID=1448308 RepID=A0A2T2NC38_CORCC|nr:hypothetical protein BS50DRAFT_102018 [Corynespora cassiicola Philippines]